MKLYSDNIDGVEYELFKCVDCGEGLLDMQQLKALGEAHKKMRKAKEVTFARWGNSLAVRIPKKLADELSLKSGSHGLMLKDEKGLRIIPE